MLEQRARDAQALLLATRDTGAALAQLAVQPADAIKELVHARRAASREELIVRRLRIAPLQVLAHGTRKQHILLQHNAHSVAQGGEVVVAHVASAHKHGAFGGVVQARNQLHKRALARARAAEDAHRRAALDAKVDMLEHILGCIRAVFKGNVAKLDTAVRWRRNREVSRGVGDKGLLIEHLGDTAHTRKSAREQQKHVGNHHERIHDQQHVAHKARERAHAQLAGENHAAANPQDRERSHVHRQLKHRQVEHRAAKGLCRSAGELGIDGVELGLLVLGTHIRLDGTHGGEVFLYHAVEVVHRGLELAVERTDAIGDGAQYDCQHGQDDRKDGGERARQHQRVDKADDKRHRAAHHRAKAVAHSILDNGDVRGHAGDERAGVVVVQVTKSERLNLFVLGLAQVSA